MAEIIQPKKKSDPLSDNFFKLAGTAVGAYFGNPQAGGAIGGMVDSDQAGGDAAGGGMDLLGGMMGGGGEKPGEIQAAQRRMDKANAPATLQRGMDALKNQPPEVQQQYGPMLQQALAQSQADQQGVIQRRQQRINQGMV